MHAAAARRARRSPGCRPTPRASSSTDAHARVHGVPDVYAAGDVTAFPIKQGGIACQQADAAAADIAARAGAPVRAGAVHAGAARHAADRALGALHAPRGAATATTEVAGRALWWPPTKIAGRELAGYLEGLDEAAGRPRACPSTSASATPARARSKS